MNFNKLFKKSIPAIITGAADNDPSGISTYSIIGAQFGYSLNWLMIISTPMLIAVEAMSARLSNVKRKGLTAIFKDHFPRPVVFLACGVVVIANIATIGADLSGMAAAITLLSGKESMWSIPVIAMVIWAIVFFANYKTIQRYLLWMVLFSVSYIFAAFLAKPDWLQVLRETFIPGFDLNYAFFAAATALLGTTISPYLFFWESAEEVESRLPKRMMLARARNEDRIVSPGFIMSNIISIFVMICTGTILFQNGITDITDAAQAASALAPFAGPYASYLFAIGILGAGLLAVPVLATTTAYSIAELFGWKDSLSDKINRAKGFYTVIGFSILIGSMITFVGINPIKALFYSQVLVGILTPFLVLLILILCNRKSVVGSLTNTFFDNVFGLLCFLVMTGAVVGFFWQMFR